MSQQNMHFTNWKNMNNIRQPFQSNVNVKPELVLIHPKNNVVHFTKDNSFFNKILGYNHIKTTHK